MRVTARFILTMLCAAFLQRLSLAAPARVTPPMPFSFPTNSAQSFDPVERTMAAAQVLESAVVSLKPGVWRRIALIKSAIQPRLLRAQEDWQENEGDGQPQRIQRALYLADQIILKVRPGTGLEPLKQRLSPLNMRVADNLAEDLWTVRLGQADLASIARGLELLETMTDMIEAVEADGVGFGAGTPNDTYFGEQWGWNNIGQFGGTTDADVDAPEFWDLIESAPGVVIAVLDSGMNFTHPDLLGIAWQNPGEIPDDGVDNDGNGRIDDVNGWDFTNADNDPTDDHG